MGFGEIEIPQTRLQYIDITFDLGKIFSHSPQPFSMPISGRDIWNPNEIEDYCVNPACKEYQDNVRKLLRDIDEGFEDVDKTGDWTKVNQEDLKYLSRFSESALNMADERDIEWSSPEARENWLRIEDKIDDVGRNFADALESTASPENDRVPGFQGLTNISKCYSSLRDLSEVKNKINESEIAVAEEETSNEHEEDERKEWIEKWEEQITELKEEVDELKEEVEGLKKRNKNNPRSGKRRRKSRSISGESRSRGTESGSRRSKKKS